jgi:hypothetical protein
VRIAPPSGSFLAALFSLLLVGISHAAIVTSVEPRLVEEMDTVRLTLRSTGNTNTESLDLSPLQKDFEVLGSNTQSQYRSVNGRVQAWVEYQISLRPKRTGELVVPSITIGAESSESIAVNVRAMDAGIKQSIQQMVFFETELSENPVYVQGQTILKRRLYYSNGVQIYSDLPGMPEITNAVVIPLGDTRSSSTVLDGQRYGVIEQQFAIFPEQSGALLVPEISITSSVRVQSGGRVRRSGIRISTEAQHIKVLPIPPEYPTDQTWLPANDVRIAQTWSPGESSFKIGEPVNRTMRVVAVGNTASAIGPLDVEFPPEHFKWYPEAPTLDDETSGAQIVGTRIEGYSLIPVNPGAVSLAEVGVTWWDTSAHQVRVARLPSTSLTITGAVLPRPPEHASPEIDPETNATEAAIERGQEDSPSKQNWPTLTPPQQQGLLIIIATAVLVLIGFKLARPARSLAAKLTPSSGKRAAWSKLKQACRGGNPRCIRSALITFIATHSDDSTGNALAHFLNMNDNASLWRQIEQAVYGRDGAAVIDPSEVLRAAHQLRKRTPKPALNPLPDLYS